MPHVQIDYTSDLKINPSELFSIIEKIINEHDSNAKGCKARAYKCEEFKYTHILIVVSMKTKDYRDNEFTKKLTNDLEKKLKSVIKQSCYFSILVRYNPKNYKTSEIHIEGDYLLDYI